MWQQQPPFKMTLFNYCTAVIFLLHCLTTGFANKNSTLLPGNNTGIGCNVNIPTLNRTNTLPACRNLKVNKSQIEEVLRLMQFSTTSTVQLQVSVASGNGCRVFPKMTWPWTSELGGTVISLVARAKESIFTSPIFTAVLAVGTKEANIHVIEEPCGSLPPGSKGLEKIFDCLLHQLSQIEQLHNAKDEHLYKLCRDYENEFSHTTYNCCRIIGDRKLKICEDYSSAVLKYTPPMAIAMFFASFSLVLPFLLQHIVFLESTKFYKTSESHMSLISVVSMLFFEGHGQTRCLIRRAFFTGLSLLVFLPDFFGQIWLMWVFFGWALCFLLVDDVEDLLNRVTTEKYKIEHVESLDKRMIFRLTEPFYCLFGDGFTEYSEQASQNENCILKFVRKEFVKVKQWLKKCELNLQPYFEKLNDWHLNNFLFLLKFCIISIFAMPFLTVWVFVNLVIFTSHDFVLPLLFPYNLSVIENILNDERKNCFTRGLIIFAIALKLPTAIMIAFLTGMIFVFAMSFFVGFCLNGEFFNPFIAPILTIIIYFWRNWKFSVEVKCLELKALIFEVCKDKATKADTTSNDDCADTERQYPAPFKDGSVRNNENTNDTDANEDGQVLAIMEGERWRNNENINDTNANESHSCKSSRWVKYLSKEEINSEQDVNAENENNKGDGEAMISKALYKEISQKIMPLSLLLFYFFRRTIFVVFYAIVMFTAMILVRQSEVSRSLQALSTIVAALLPFVFDTVWGEQMLVQTTATNEAIKQKLEQLLKVSKRETMAGIAIVVEVVENDVNQENNIFGSGVVNNGISTRDCREGQLQLQQYS